MRMSEGRGVDGVYDACVGGGDGVVMVKLRSLGSRYERHKTSKHRQRTRTASRKSREERGAVCIRVDKNTVRA
jgi:hypothetical protein